MLRYVQLAKLRPRVPGAKGLRRDVALTGHGNGEASR